MSPNFKLLITTDTEYTWNYSMNLSEFLINYIKAEVMLISVGKKPSEAQLAEAQKFNIHTSHADYSSKVGPIMAGQNKNALNYLENAIKEFNPDLVHINNQVFYGVNTDKPKIITVHEDYIEKIKWVENRGKNISFSENLVKHKDFIADSLNNADIVVTPSRFTAGQLFDIYKLKTKLNVIHNGINIGSQLNNEPIKDLSILAVSHNWDRSKNLGLFLKAASKLPNNIKINLVGECNYYREIPKRINYLGVLPHKELLKAYQNASIYLAPSSFENFGITLTEAALSDCAIVANDIPVFRELWDDCACFYERNNLNSLIRNLNNLIENDRVLKITARSCYTKALSTYTLKKMGFEYMNLYKYVLKKSAMSSKENKSAPVK